MINIILAVLTFVVGVAGYDSQPLEHITIYNAPCEFNIDNVDKVVYLYPFGYILTWEYRPNDFVFVWDFYDYWAMGINQEGFYHVDF